MSVLQTISLGRIGSIKSAGSVIYLPSSRIALVAWFQRFVGSQSAILGQYAISPSHGALAQSRVSRTTDYRRTHVRIA